MPHPSALGLFILLPIALALVPGPAVLSITGESESQRCQAGLANVAGIVLAGIVHVAGAAPGELS